jgi:hypothetical protein
MNSLVNRVSKKPRSGDIFLAQGASPGSLINKRKSAENAKERVRDCLSPFQGFILFLIWDLGLAPQAKGMSPLRGFLDIL